MPNEWRRGLAPGVIIGICFAAFLLLKAPAFASRSSRDWVAAMLIALLGPVTVTTALYGLGVHRLRPRLVTTASRWVQRPLRVLAFLLAIVLLAVLMWYLWTEWPR